MAIPKNKKSGDIIYDNFDEFTGQLFTSKVSTHLPNGMLIADSIVDNAVILKNKPEFGGGYSIRTNQLAGEPISYMMFGAAGDGITDDSAAIKKAHRTGNLLNLPVVNTAGTYYLGVPNSIEIKTSVDWGQSKFIIDEKLYNGEWRFIVKGYKEWQNVTLDSASKTSFLSKWKRVNGGVITELAEYSGHYFIIEDSTDLAYRSGGAVQSKPKRDQFIIEKGGALIGDVNWELTDYTSLRAIELEESITIKGGSFTFLGGGSADPEITGYHNTFMKIERSNTEVSSFYVDRPNADIVNNKPSNGFYFIENASYVTLKDGRLVPKIPAGQGSYGLGGDTVFEFKLENLQADGDGAYWGVMGVNNIKNLRVRNCKLNRVDVHFNAWNVYIDDTLIGTESIRLSGGGDLFINNTVNRGGDAVSSFIIIRSDWTASWDGDIRVKNCRHAVVNSTAVGSWVQWGTDAFNYNVKQILCRELEITDSEVSFFGNNADFRMIWLPFRSMNTQNTISPRIIFPRKITFRNISVTGRGKGVTPLAIQYSEDFAPFAGAANASLGVDEYNTLIEIENLPTNGVYDTFNVLQGFPDKHTNYVKPKIYVKNLKSNFEVYINKGFAKLDIQDCVVNRLVFGDPAAGTYATIVANIENSTIQLVTRGAADELSKKPFWVNPSNTNPSFRNCVIQNGRNFSTPFTTYPQWLEASNGLFTPQRYFDTTNSKWYKRSLMGHHSNCRLGSSLLNLFSTDSVSIPPLFMDELKNSKINRYSLQLPNTRGATTQRPAPDTSPVNGSGSVNGVPYNGLIYVDTTISKALIWETEGWIEL